MVAKRGVVIDEVAHYSKPRVLIAKIREKLARYKNKPYLCIVISKNVWHK